MQYSTTFRLGLLYSKVRNAIRPYIGGVTDIVNWDEVVRVELEFLLANGNPSQAAAETGRLLEQFMLPTEVILELSSIIRTDLRNAIVRGLGPIRGGHRYNFVIKDIGGEPEIMVVDEGDLDYLRYKEAPKFVSFDTAQTGDYMGDFLPRTHNVNF